MRVFTAIRPIECAMKKITILVLALLAALVQAGTSLVSIAPDPVTGRMVKTVYTKYYDAGVWVLPGRLGLSIVVDQLDESRGKVTTYAWNRDSDAHTIKFLKIAVRGAEMKLDKQSLVAVPAERSGLEVGQAEILNFHTTLLVSVTYELDGSAATTELTLERRTAKDMKRYFGKGGKPPYPWYQD
jgi:hypothetical protein